MSYATDFRFQVISPLLMAAPYYVIHFVYNELEWGKKKNNCTERSHRVVVIKAQSIIALAD